ncbi:hypothetical protein N9Y89_01910 [bacterium]|nr:hypothetical protein [bacterium]
MIFLSYKCQLYHHYWLDSINLADSEIVASILTKEGFSTTPNLEDADIVFVNTCSIREKAELMKSLWSLRICHDSKDVLGVEYIEGISFLIKDIQLDLTNITLSKSSDIKSLIKVLGVSKTKRLEFSQFIKKYLLKRENLMCLCVLLDSRLKPQAIDIEFMQWLGENNIPFVICFTKQDKLSKTESAKNLAHYKKEMLKS